VRKALSEELCRLASLDSRLIFITGDLGFQVFDQFKANYPKRFLNVGIAEAGAIGVAAGLSINGFKPVVYSIASFLTSRAFEQIRFFSAQNSCPLILVGAGSGFNYGNSGPTHHALDDIGLASLIPDIEIFTPIGPKETKDSLREAFNSTKSAYIQIGKYGELDLQISLNTGNSICGLIAYGSSARILNQYPDYDNVFGHYCDTFFFRKVSDIDSSEFTQFINNHSELILVEDQFEKSGLSLEILNTVAKLGLPATRFTRFGPSHEFIHLNFTEEQFRDYYKYSAQHLLDYFRRNFEK